MAIDLQYGKKLRDSDFALGSKWKCLLKFNSLFSTNSICLVFHQAWNVIFWDIQYWCLFEKSRLKVSRSRKKIVELQGFFHIFVAFSEYMDFSSTFSSAPAHNWVSESQNLDLLPNKPVHTFDSFLAGLDRNCLHGRCSAQRAHQPV